MKAFLTWSKNPKLDFSDNVNVLSNNVLSDGKHVCVGGTLVLFIRIRLAYEKWASLHAFAD